VLETELRPSDDTVAFVVRTSEPRYVEALQTLVFTRADDEFIRVFPSDAGDLDAIHQRFAARLEELLEQTTGRLATPWQQALAELVGRLERTGASWFVCGSAALAARGIPVQPRDVDFVTSDHAGVAAALSDALIEPLSRDAGRTWIAGWFGRAWLGARVEWIAGVYPEIDSSPMPNEFGPTAARRLERIEWNGRALLLSPLDLQREVSRQRGLDDRVGAIDRYESARGS
jgi:hypothetical protein